MATRSVFCAVFLLALGAPVRPGHAQTIQGVVRQDPSGDLLQGAAVRLLDAHDAVLDEVLSDDDGRFAIRLSSPGSYRLEVTLIGFGPGRSALFTVGPDDEPSVEIFLTVEPVRLDSLVVRGEPRNPRLEMAGFYNRLADDVGHFILREEIEERSPQKVTDVLYGLPGMRVAIVNSLTGEYDVVMRAGSTMSLLPFNKSEDGRVTGVCYPTVVLDGTVVRPGGARGVEVGSWNELVHPSEIEAIEAYPSAAGLPVQYAGSRSPCGAILIWTRR